MKNANDMLYNEICEMFDQLDEEMKTENNSQELTFEEFMYYESRFNLENEIEYAELIINGEIIL